MSFSAGPYSGNGGPARRGLPRSAREGGRPAAEPSHGAGNWGVAERRRSRRLGRGTAGWLLRPGWHQEVLILALIIMTVAAGCLFARH
jgi:hypothetical protein